jgi:hypothetical protein
MDGRKNTPSKGTSLALGCFKKDAKRMNEMLRSQGVTSASFDVNTGLAQWEDKNGRNALYRLHGCIDRDGGYSDHVGK